MAKINLLTIHWGLSYGGTMQTYATLKTLRNLGHDVTLINLVHPNLKERKVKFTPKGLLNEVRTLQFVLFRFLHFGKRTKKMYYLNPNYIPEADYTVVGSDQVWNSDITTKIKLSYFLDFAKKTKRLSYASSFGKYEWEEDKEYTTKVKSELTDFKAISVRDESGVKICKDVFGLNAIQLLDPTLMHSDYSELVNKNKHIKEIFAFLLNGKSEENVNICKMVSEELGIPVYHPSRIQKYFGCSPIAWLNRIKNSSFIITDSFHGLALSILFRKQFLVVCADKNKFARLHSLLHLIHYENRHVLSTQDLTSRKEIIFSQIDYEIVDVILTNEREKSMCFLKRNLDNQYENNNL